MIALFLLFALQSPIAQMPIGTDASKYDYPVFTGSRVVPASGKVEVVFPKDIAAKLLRAPSCRVTDETKDGPVFMRDASSREHVIFIAPPKHRLSWECRGTIRK